ncbi:xylosyltransferase oxt [Leptinotarsa decemlineata]|uniref:xylosyltransferase oxt n=1 Tax=Leptinotarsa decemlineata TaxID=7539 RepID=UPI000C252ED1|nr:xylosyltransferase oxt [Leptinotarsa decemlineata]
MIKLSIKNSKWMRRYRTFFIIGILILSFQIFLAAKFISTSKSNEPEENKWLPLSSGHEVYTELEFNSARSKSENNDEEVSSVVQKNKSKSKVNQTHLLRYEELDFVPLCQITTKEAVSAINRAKTQYCKQLISNMTCLSIENRLYPKELRGSCPSDGMISGKELGCFKDEKNFRLLSGYFGVNKRENSPKYCIDLCLQSGFPYAGVQYSNECFCGVDEPPLSSKIPDSSCNLKCPGDQHSTCGGYYKINVYQTGIRRFVPQAANILSTNVTRESAKIVFLLTLNGRALRQVKRLLKILYHIDHYYYIHVDIRQDYLFRELLSLEKQLPNVRLTRKRFATIWGGASLLRMLRYCMWEILNIKEWKWDFVLNLSESDFPVKTVAQLTQFLTLNKNRNFVKSHGREVQRFIQKQGLDKTFVECETRMWRIGDRVLPSGIQLDGGSDWIALSRRFVEYVANPAPDDLISGLLKIFNYTLLPAESFFHTALRNSKFCDSYIDNNLHVTNWKRKLGCKCQYKHVVDWCGCSPNDFRPEDWPRIQNTLSRQIFFARKFEPTINQEVILQLELWLYGLDKPPKHVQNLYGYWQNVYHHQDLGITPDDGLLTVGNSIKRRVSKMFSKLDKSCDIKIGKLFQVNTYHFNDTYNFNVFTYNTSEMYQLEIAVRPISHISVVKKTPLNDHLEVFLVSSDYDQKEQLSRNFMRILSPYSEPVLIYNFFFVNQAQKVYNMTCLWISPSGDLNDVTEYTIDETSSIGHVKPNLKQPISPGIWEVKVIHKDILIMETKFLITPLEFYSGSLFRERQINLANNGSILVKKFKGPFEKFLSVNSKKRQLEVSSISDSKNREHFLTEWIDKLQSKFFQMEKMCAVVSASVDICGETISACVKTNWSSFAPDPKSAIGTNFKSTGNFNIW